MISLCQQGKHFHCGDVKLFENYINGVSIIQYQIRFIQGAALLLKLIFTPIKSLSFKPLSTVVLWNYLLIYPGLESLIIGDKRAKFFLPLVGYSSRDHVKRSVLSSSQIDSTKQRPSICYVSTLPSFSSPWCNPLFPCNLKWCIGPTVVILVIHFTQQQKMVSVNVSFMLVCGENKWESPS